MRDDENIVGWFSLDNGQHVPLRKGESKKEATQKFLSNKGSSVARNREKYNKIDDFRKRKATNKLKKDNEDVEYLNLDEDKKTEGILNRFDVSEDGKRYTLKPELKQKYQEKYNLRYEDDEEKNKEDFY